MTIFGYTWDEIKRAQQGGALARRIPAGIYKPLATDPLATTPTSTGGSMNCKKCTGEMKPSKAIEQTYQGTPDFPGKEVVTLSPGGPGRLVDCLKCVNCGWSMTVPTEAV